MNKFRGVQISDFWSAFTRSFYPRLYEALLRANQELEEFELWADNDYDTVVSRSSTFHEVSKLVKNLRAQVTLGSPVSGTRVIKVSKNGLSAEKAQELIEENKQLKKQRDEMKTRYVKLVNAARAQGFDVKSFAEKDNG